MEYTVSKLAQISNITTRTLRYYDEIGLLKPARVSSNGYRIYGRAEVDTLQQILFFRELGVGINDIKQLLTAPDFSREQALQKHLTSLRQKKEQIEALIENVSKTISSLKGEIAMSDKEKFNGFKQRLIDENEQKYGREAKEKYGDAIVNAANSKFMGLDEAQYAEAEHLRVEINKNLKAAMVTGNPACERAQKACMLHGQWICMFWTKGAYTKQAHKALGRMYVRDGRFKKYYDDIAEGCAVFFQKALELYCAE
jgi:Predicted transcriptional regulators